jgi:hypothetical protein
MAVTGRDFGLCDLSTIKGSGYGVFHLNNPTPGTAISGHAAATTFDETKALLYMYNGGPRDVYMLQGMLKLSNAGTGGTTIRLTGCIDTGPRTPSSGNAAANTLSKGGTSGQSGSGITAYFGAVVIPAASSGRQIVHDHQLRSVIGVVLDTYGFAYGSPGCPPLEMPQTATNGTAEVDMIVNLPAVRIPPGMLYTIHQWSASQSAAYQFEPVNFDYLES